MFYFSNILFILVNLSFGLICSSFRFSFSSQFTVPLQGVKYTALKNKGFGLGLGLGLSTTSNLEQEEITTQKSLKGSKNKEEIGSDSTENEEEKVIIQQFLIAESINLGGADWEVTQIRRTNVNTCFKCTPIGRKGKSVFVKYSRESIGTKSQNRLRCEFEGMRVFSKYSPKEVPKIILYDDEKRILISEWLENYVPMSKFFGFSALPKGEIGLGPALRLERSEEGLRGLGHQY